MEKIIGLASTNTTHKMKFFINSFMMEILSYRSQSIEQIKDGFKGAGARGARTFSIFYNHLKYFE